MIISVASGKGGTGKTTVATNLALALDQPVQLLDCDVEEPNAHLFLQPEFVRTRYVDTFVPRIDDTLCSACRKCAEICRFRALTVVGEQVLVFPELCHSCGGCLAVCPEGAVGDDSRRLGVVETGTSRTIGFAHGRLRVGEAMAPPLIGEVRRESDTRATVIIDAPPGTSCPVIAAMRGSDFILLVTEPTPFGLHDLQLAVEAVRILGIPCGLVINRSDLGDDRVHEYAAREGVPILAEIAFDRRIAEIYSRGLMIIESLPEYRDTFRVLYEQIKTIVNTGRPQ